MVAKSKRTEEAVVDITESRVLQGHFQGRVVEWVAASSYRMLYSKEMIPIKTLTQFYSLSFLIDYLDLTLGILQNVHHTLFQCVNTVR